MSKHHIEVEAITMDWLTSRCASEKGTYQSASSSCERLQVYPFYDGRMSAIPIGFPSGTTRAHEVGEKEERQKRGAGGGGGGGRVAVVACSSAS